MSYYNMLGLAKEPFSTSPDPAFFYLSAKHKAILYKLRVAIKLKRGLSVVLGNVGTGKTTLARRLFQILKSEDENKDDILFYVMLNPISRSEREFLLYLAELFQIELPARRLSSVNCIRKIEEHLFRKGVTEKKTIVLLIDEAQKLSAPCLEILRVLLNYETNEYKILQVVLMGQTELLERLKKMENFWDRVSLKYMLQPLNREETKEMMFFRLERAGYDGNSPVLFREEAVDEIYNYSGGYPRKITMLCHDALENLVMEKKDFVDKEIVSKLFDKEVSFAGA
ncbi:MAG: AAA family ATPase [Candidatus Omnitrophota bacterium]